MKTTNYRDTFIAVAADCTVDRGTIPEKRGTIAALQYALLADAPYAMTSDDLLFEVHARRAELAEADRDTAREALFAKPQACLRASPLAKSFGWGIHHDAEGRIAIHGRETEAYRELQRDERLHQTAAMRSKRG